MKRIHINPEYCKGCSICIDACPEKALKNSNKMNAKGYILPMPNDTQECKGCKLCEMMCPDFAIAIEVVEE